MEGGDKWDERVEGGYKGVQECSTGGFKYTDMSLVKSQRMPPEKKKNKVRHKFQSDCTNLGSFWIFDFKKNKIMNVSDFKLQRL